MTKKIIVVVVVAVLVAAGAYWYFNRNQMTAGNSAANTVTSSAPSTPAAAIVKVPYNPQTTFAKTQKPLAQGQTFKDGKGNTIALAPLTGSQYQGTNLESGLSLNGKQLDIVDGSRISDAAFSPDGTLFAFRTLSSCGAGCDVYGLEVVDITNQKAFHVRTSKASYNLDKARYGLVSATAFIEAYSWDTNRGLRYTFYYIGTDSSGNTYRVSPKQSWSLDVTKNSSALLGTLPG